MKVYQLIRELAKYDPNLDVAISEGNEQTWKGDFTVLLYENNGKVEVDIGIDDLRV